MRDLLQKSIEKQEEQIIVQESFCGILFSIYLLCKPLAVVIEEVF